MRTSPPRLSLRCQERSRLCSAVHDRRPTACRLQPLLLAAFGHTHKRVKAAALHLLQACLRVDGGAFEAAAADIMPPVMELLTTHPAAIATTAQAVVTAMAERLPADALAYALLAATEVRPHCLNRPAMHGYKGAITQAHERVQSKSYHVKLHAFEAFSRHIGPGTPAGAPHDARTTARLLATALAAFSAHGQAADLRHAAVAVVCTIHSYSPDLVVREVHNFSGPGTGQTDLMRVRSRDTLDVV